MNSANWLSSADGQAIDPVLECLVHLARHADRSTSPVLLRAGLALREDGTLPFHQVEASLDQIGLHGEPLSRKLRGWPDRKLPAILELTDHRAVVLLEVRNDDARIFAPGVAEPLWVKQADLSPVLTGRAVAVEIDPTQERIGERPWDKARRSHWFWSEVWKVRKEFRPVILAAVIINLLAFAMPLFTMNVYDRIIPNRAVSTLWVLALGVGLALLFDFALRIARARLIDEVGRKIDTKLSQKLFEKVMNLPLAARQGSTGAIARRVSEFELVRDFFASTTIVLAVDVLFLVFFLALITVLAGWLVLIPITGILVMFAFGVGIQRAMSTATVNAQADASLQHSILVESISGIETLKSARAEGQMLGRWRRYAQMSAATQEKLRRLNAVAINLASVAQQFISVGLLIGGFYRFQAGDMSLGAIIAIIMLAGRSLQPVGQLAFLVTRGKQAMATLRSLQTMMETEDERAMVKRTIIPEIRAGSIKFEDAAFRYPEGSRDSLSALNVEIKPGERIGVVGRVASGKSTFGRLICGLYAPSQGAMLVDSLDSRQYHPHQLRDAFRFVGQDSEVFSGTVRENLMLGSAQADDAQLLDAVRRSGADIFLSRDASGFDLPVGERGAFLSGGQRALLVLARSLVSPSRLLFLDEPTGAMDSQTERYFIEHLNSAMAGDQTLVVATHRHSMLSILDRLIVIDAGKVIADGPRDEVLAELAKHAERQGQKPKGDGA